MTLQVGHYPGQTPQMVPLTDVEIPMGATYLPRRDGTFFKVHAPELFGIAIHDMETKAIKLVIQFHPHEKIDNVWQKFVSGIGPKDAYTLIVTMEGSPWGGVLDPHTKGVIIDRRELHRGGKYKPLGAILDPRETFFDWEGVINPVIPDSQLIIYEMHVRGFTKDPSSAVTHPGTFQAMIDKIPYLQELGINAVELLPIQEFNETDYHNYWGYSSMNFFSLMSLYATSTEPAAVILEFKHLVRELHRAGIQVILDVVFNHTGEGNEQGTKTSFKAMDEESYFMMKDGWHQNHSGCGNTMNVNHPVTRKHLIAALEYWVTEFHIDGFRFDLAGAFTRDGEGTPIDGPAPFITAMQHSSILKKVKLIAEPWDTSTYRSGYFSQTHGMKEWNDRFRDASRGYLSGDTSKKGDFATAICGSEPIFGTSGSPLSSINYTTCHDGFSLRDLVSYSRPTNEGHEYAKSLSWNCGHEGPTEDPDVEAIRQRQMRTMHLGLMIAQGIPMLRMGDEYGHTQDGHNNTWDVDDRRSWFQWDEVPSQRNLFRFFSLMNVYRISHPLLSQEGFLSDERISWHGHRPSSPSWDPADPVLAYTLTGDEEQDSIYIAFNNGSKGEHMQLPEPLPGRQWVWIVNTGCASPDDIHREEDAPPVTESLYLLGPHSGVLIQAKKIFHPTKDP